ncbi:hypothetical protein HCN44_007832 [Aphidius gifuensis]|uniref:NAD-dependent protein deacetylase n=1 Tax=Aphidius gifuensis TaxID=684658 RepID=A0A834XLN9_APHGI|nr:hypothetical protein HCN44_007832 [Aphidius gifuensis]
MKKAEVKEEIDNEKDSVDNQPGPSSTDEPKGEVDGDFEMDKIRKFLTNLKIFDTGDKLPKKQILNELTLDGIVEFIKKSGCKKIITMVGAGISTSAGIPDFRSPSSGLYHNLSKYKLPHPQAIFELEFFKENPEPFFVLAKELLPEGFKPTLSHYFVRLLWEKGLLLRHYTQNIDTLERVAGLPDDKLVEAHGTFHTGHCLKCRSLYDFTWIKNKVVEGTIPKCEKCIEGVVKPDIVFFGEMLPERFHQLSDCDFDQADLLIIMGSSLVVQPFASLVDRVKTNCPRLLINMEKVSGGDRLSRMFGIRQGFDFNPDDPEFGRDVAWIGDCDTGCQLLADKMGWGVSHLTIKFIL